MTPEYTGIYSALVTPFTADDNLDLVGLARLVDDQIANGAAGLLVNGSTGEFPSMTPAERRATAETTLQAADGRAEVIVGVGAMRTSDAVAYAEHAKSIGARSGLLIMPYYEPLTDTEMFRHVEDVAAVGLPIMLYNNPGGTGRSLTPQFIASLANAGLIESVKDTTGEPSRLFEIDDLSGRRVQLLSGQDTSTIFALATGRAAALWGACNAHPKACCTLWSLINHDQRLDLALELWQPLWKLNQFFESHNYVSSVKAATNLRGVAVGIPRAPILPLDTASIAELSERMSAVDMMLDELSRTTPGRDDPVLSTDPTL